MLQENEVVMLASGCAVFLFAIAQRSQLQRIPHWRTLFAAYGLLLLAWTATVLEGFVLPDALNLVEHSCYAAGALSLAVWCWHLGARLRGAEAGC